MLDVIRAGNTALWIGVLDRALVTVGLRRKDKALPLAARLHRPPARIARSRNRSRSRAVIAAIAGDDLGLAGVHARDFEGRLIGLRPRRRKEEFLETGRKQLEQLLRQPRPRSGRKSRQNIRQLPRLLSDRLDHSRVLVAEIDAHQLRREIQIALARSIDEIAALGINDMQRLPTLLDAPGAVVIFARDARDLLGCKWRLGIDLDGVAHGVAPRKEYASHPNTALEALIRPAFELAEFQRTKKGPGIAARALVFCGLQNSTRCRAALRRSSLRCRSRQIDRRVDCWRCRPPGRPAGP